jgi:hypothetical protein
MIKRDRAILEYLEKFRVLSRDQIAALVCPEVANPAYIANRICKRLGRDGYLTVLPQRLGEQYLYMPDPPIIHPRSTRINHFLKIADLYIELGKPNHYDVEPPFNNYRPDVYATIGEISVCIEVQLTRVAKRKIQSKVDRFVRSYYLGEHKARVIWIYTEKTYDLKAPNGIFTVKQGVRW